jgi:hypothetical protein
MQLQPSGTSTTATLNTAVSITHDFGITFVL